jgi:hypothetical protein
MGFKPETVMYWSRVALGALLGAVYAFFWRPPWSIISSLSFALIVYLLTYHLFKILYGGVLSDKSTVWKEGIGSFFLSWLFTWFLLYNTLFRPG